MASLLASESRSSSASDPEGEVLEKLSFWLGRIHSAVIEVKMLRDTCQCLSRENEELRAERDELKKKLDLLTSRLKPTA